MGNSPVQEAVSEWKPPSTSHQAPAIVPLHPNSTTDFEEETDEMDALDGSRPMTTATAVTK